MRKGEETRTRILDVAEAAVLQKGFGGTSIEELIAETGITKSGFFYHFRDKNELAKALLNRYIENDERIYDEIFSRARDLMDDPLQSFLLGLKLLSELLSDLPNGHPGCLVATICYYERLFDREIQEINRQAALTWRRRFRGMFDEIFAVYTPREHARRGPARRHGLDGDRRRHRAVQGAEGTAKPARPDSRVPQFRQTAVPAGAACLRPHIPIGMDKNYAAFKMLQFPRASDWRGALVVLHLRRKLCQFPHRVEIARCRMLQRRQFQFRAARAVRIMHVDLVARDMHLLAVGRDEFVERIGQALFPAGS